MEKKIDQITGMILAESPDNQNALIRETLKIIHDVRAKNLEENKAAVSRLEELMDEFNHSFGFNAIIREQKGLNIY